MNETALIDLLRELAMQTATNCELGRMERTKCHSDSKLTMVVVTRGVNNG